MHGRPPQSNHNRCCTCMPRVNIPDNITTDSLTLLPICSSVLFHGINMYSYVTCINIWLSQLPLRFPHSVHTIVSYILSASRNLVYNIQPSIICGQDFRMLYIVVGYTIMAGYS